MIHKRILDAAGGRPDAALAEIADEVPGASTDLVERVLDEYGDPAAADAEATAAKSPDTPGQEPAGGPSTPPDEPRDQTPTADSTSPDQPTTPPSREGPDEATTSQAEDGTDNDPRPEAPDPAQHERTEQERNGTAPDTPVDLDALTDKRRETLRAISAYPEASQRDIADMLGVTAATISQRVNAIDGFQWSNRAQFIEGLFEETQAEFDAALDVDTEPANPDAPTTAPAEKSPGDPARSESAPLSNVATFDGGRNEYTRELFALRDRITELESKLDEQHDYDVDDPELIAKVIHACLDAETISTDEEHQIIQQLIP